MNKIIQEHLQNTFASQTSNQLRRPFSETYWYKNQRRERPLQFLRPELYCYAYPRYSTTEPSSQPKIEYITARIVNAGGAPSTNTVIQMVGYEEGERIRPGSRFTTRRVRLQAGQAHTETFAFSTIERMRFYQLVCFDPLHDPVTQMAITQMQPVSRDNILSNAVDPIPLGVRNKITDWDEFTQHNNGSWQPATMNSWLLAASNPNPGTSVSQRYFAAGSATPSASQLRQTITISNLNLGEQMLSYLDSGNLRATLDGFVYLNGNARAMRGQIELNFLAANGTLLHSFTSPNPTQRNIWIRINGSVAVPSGTAQIVCKLIAVRQNPISNRTNTRSYPLPFNSICFDELFLQLTPRNIYTSSRIYSNMRPNSLISIPGYPSGR